MDSSHPDGPTPDRSNLGWRASAIAFALIFTAIFLLHLSLLRLPYFWDEAGYYVPAAHDLLLSGSLIPLTSPSNAHPPLVMAFLAAAWKILGYKPIVTRGAMLLVAAFTLLGLFRLAHRIANFEVAVAATLCAALYPVFFAQSSLAHVDLAAAGLTFWALHSCLAGRMPAALVWFSLAALAKETAILVPAALFVWEVLCPALNHYFNESIGPVRIRWKRAASLLVPIAVLSLWYAYHYARTGYVFGNPEFFRYNVQATMNPLRILLTLGMRIWQVVGYLHLSVLTLLMLWAMTRPPITNGEHQRIAVPDQLVLAVVILAYVVAMSVVGGAVLARYMLTAVPLVIVIAVSTLRRRIRAWRWLVGVVCAAFVAALFINPPYGFAPEDNLAYRDFIVMHEDAARFLETHYSSARVLTAWPASGEISQPQLGYISKPLRVVRIEDFTAEEILAAAEERSRFDVALVFSTKYEPPHPLVENWRWWENIKIRFFGYHRDLPPPVIAQLLGGQVVFQEQAKGQWVAVIELERVEDASSRHHHMTGMRLHNQPDLAARS